MAFLGCPPPEPFLTPLVKALPLADQPHILQPNSRREDLFGMPRQQVAPHQIAETEGKEDIFRGAIIFARQQSNVKSWYHGSICKEI